MSPTHMWVLEVYLNGAWRYMHSCDTRGEARHIRACSPSKRIRIRKYVPA